MSQTFRPRRINTREASDARCHARPTCLPQTFAGQPGKALAAGQRREAAAAVCSEGLGAKEFSHTLARIFMSMYILPSDPHSSPRRWIPLFLFFKRVN